jgi:predicted ATP-dependent endonuclease of OLD family
VITLTNAEVWKYKCIEDSTPVKIEPDVTVLVGKNESGKSAFLEALRKALPLENEEFDVVFDFPRKDYSKYLPQHNRKNYENVARLTFQIDDALAERINSETFNGKAVIPSGFSFIRTTDYSNQNSIALTLNNALAMEALKEELAGLDHTDEVFANATDLRHVVTQIEALKLSADSRLAIFAKAWQERCAKATSGWDMINWHVWSTYLSPNLPRFLYFDDYNLLEGKINLPDLNSRKVDQNKSLTAADETALGLLELAGIELDELIREKGYENAKAQLEAIGLSITQQVFQYWKQNQELAAEFDIKSDPTDKPPFNNGANLYIRIKNLRHGVTVPFDQRSKGFIWFFSFMAWFSAVEERVQAKTPLILLLDEPGLSLHALAQNDFLQYIDALSESRQIIYTTHSPFMVRNDQLQRVRVVEDRPQEGTTVTSELEGSSRDSLFPLQAALGYTIAQNLFIEKKNVLVEGPADLLLLQHMSSVLEQAGRTSLQEGIFVPVGGLDKLATFVALLGANELELIVLHDRGSAPHQKLNELIHARLIEQKRILDYSMFREPRDLETDIEDLFPEQLYLAAFNDIYAKDLGDTIQPQALPQHPRIVERINRWLDQKGKVLLKSGGFNHYRVAQALLSRLNLETLSAKDLDRFEALFSRINEALR